MASSNTLNTLYTVWSVRRDRKALVIANNDDPSLYENVILKGKVSC